MARASMTKTSIDYWSVDLGKVCIYDSIEKPGKFVDAINAAIDEEIAAALSGKLVLEKHDCGPDTQRPKDMEIVLVNTDENFYVMRYDQEYFHTRNFETIISFADADYWCRLKGVK